MRLKKLNERDGRAVDAFLMNGRDMNPSNSPVAVAAEGMDNVVRILRLLEVLDETVPDDLAKRTIDRLNARPFPNVGGDSVSDSADRPPSDG